MDVDNVRRLLTRYYEGTTSLDEERMLAGYFAAADVPADLQADKALFAQLEAGEVHVPDGLGDRLEAAIDRMDMAHRLAVRRRLMPRWFRSVAVAASVAMVLVAGYSVMTYRHTAAVTPEDTCQSPQEAYEYAQAALVKVSRSLNRADAQVAQAERTVNGVMEKLDRHITIN